MAVIQILSFFILILCLSHFFQERIVDVLPVAACLLTMFLVTLGFAGRLSMLDAVNVCVIVLTVIWFGSRTAEKRAELFRFLLKELRHPGVIVVFAAIVLVTVCVSSKVVTWWDDYNFWATDVKSIFYLDGFAGKYRNVAPEFGDYPPGTQMMKWWFLHLQPEAFSEGLMFAGYYCLNLLFLTPLLRRLPGKNPLVVILGTLFLFMFPSVAEGFYLTGTCADLTMAVIYGAFLGAVVDDDGHSRFFYYSRLSLYLMVLVLVKNVGFLWAAFAILFFLVYHFYRRRKHWIGIGAVILLPVLTFGGWLAFCLMMRRVAKLTGAAVQMAVKGVHLPGDTKEFMKTFAEAFAIWPLHRWKTWAIDLTPLLLFLLICLFLFIYRKRNVIEQGLLKILIGYSILSGMIFYGINLVSHLTIFAVEDQYLQPFNMISSIERYGAPFTVGSLYLIVFMWFVIKAPSGGTEQRAKRQADRYREWLVLFILVFLCVDHKMVYQGLWGYRQETETQLADRENIVGSEGKAFLNELKESEETSKVIHEGGMRVLYVRDGTNPHWVNNTYISFEASPVSVMYASIVPGEAEEEAVRTAVAETHAQYLYLDNLGEQDLPLFEKLVPQDDFQYGILYRVSLNEGKLTLTKADHAVQ